MIFEKRVAVLVEFSEKWEKDRLIEIEMAERIIEEAEEGEEHELEDEDGDLWVGSWTYKPARDSDYEWTGYRY